MAFPTKSTKCKVPLVKINLLLKALNNKTPTRLKLQLAVLSLGLIGVASYLSLSIALPYAVEDKATQSLNENGFTTDSNYAQNIGLWESSFKNIHYQKHGFKANIGDITFQYSWPQIAEKQIDNALVTNASFSIPAYSFEQNQFSPWVLASIQDKLSQLPANAVYIKDSELSVFTQEGMNTRYDLNAWASQDAGSYSWNLTAKNESNILNISGTGSLAFGPTQFTSILETKSLSNASDFLHSLAIPKVLTELNAKAKATRIETTVNIDEGKPENWVLLAKSRATKFNYQQANLYAPTLHTIIKGDAIKWNRAWSHANRLKIALSSALMEAKQVNIEHKQGGNYLAQVQSIEWIHSQKEKGQFTGPTRLDGPFFIESENNGKKQNLKLSNVNLSMPKLKIEAQGLNSSIQLISIAPPRAITPGKLTFQSMSLAALPLTQGKAEFEFSRDGTLNINKAAALCLGGKVLFKGKINYSENNEVSLMMRLKDIDMQQLASIFPEFSGNAQGKLSGELSLRLHNNTLELIPGKLTLSQSEDSSISYNAEHWLTDQVPEDHHQFQALTMVEEAFKQLKLEALEIIFFASQEHPIQAKIEGNAQVAEQTLPLRMELNLNTPWLALQEWAKNAKIELKLQESSV